MKIEWGWDDGYVGGRPKQVIEIPDEDLENLSEEDQKVIIDEYVEAAFKDQVTYWWNKK